MRTHMLVCLGATLFVMSLEQEGAGHDAMSRVIQGIADVKGLTTAAGIWSAAAIGVAVGLGREGTAVLGTLMALAVLHVMPLLVDASPDGGNGKDH
ncbi:hypothetical protein PCA10_26740 [Metapseudomonas resinovorans NBRC 106553]|uniref:Protein MgtC n=1 Tax=Metapseudomonas resinovorans NBRC 106553 TaxID=1245471 RepID=S6AVD4_METRE|nr:hypothetical protein PCA10_26740 [Pseudomonas resinovorans NBRC 106553]